MQTGLPATEAPAEGIDFLLALFCLHRPHLAAKTGEHYHEIGNETYKNISLIASYIFTPIYLEGKGKATTTKKTTKYFKLYD